MNKKKEKSSLRSQLVSWVDGDRETHDPTLFVMEQRPPRFVPPTEEEREEREQRRLHHFFNWYPLAALILCGILMGVLMAAVLKMPEEGLVQLGESLVTGSWELELLGECCLLFLSVSGVRLLLRGRKEEQKVLETWAELDKHLLLGYMLGGAALLIILVMMLGGIAGGAATGALLAVPPLVTGGKLLRCRGYAQTGSLLLCVILSGISIYAGTNGYVEAEILTMELLKLAAGLSAACAVYNICSLAAENRAADLDA